MRKKQVLVVDDDPIMRESLVKVLLSKKEMEVGSAVNGREAREQVKQEQFDLVITDVKMPQMSGLELLKEIKRISPATSVIVMTAYGTVESAVQAMKDGALDYLTKPFSADELEVVVNKVFEHRRLQDENRYLREEINSRFDFSNIVGSCESMQHIFDLIRTVAPTNAAVLIQGESGTGKELVARALHYHSQRAGGPFIKVNCAALSSNLLESELFGHEKGSFTNAFYKKAGRFELADKGTLLLDEITEMEPGLQSKLLRVLQEGEFDRVGGTVPVKTDVRIISTTNRNLAEEMRNSRFRSDLFYRLNVVPIVLPALRQRREDIPPLIRHFLEKYNRANRKKILSVHPQAAAFLQHYDWPGNVRELENTIQRAVVLCRGEQIALEDLLFETAVPQDGCRTAPEETAVVTLQEIEKKAILQALETCKQNRTHAARMLGITARTMRNKLKEFREAENFSGAAV